MNKIGLIMILALTLVSCKDVVEDNSMNSEPNIETEDKVVEEVKTVIKNVYIHEDDFDEYNPYNSDITETDASYWYIQYDTREVRGFGVYELDTPYFDLVDMLNKLKVALNNPSYLQISFFKRVTFECYRKSIEHDV
jgi:hypothetical protein